MKKEFYKTADPKELKKEFIYNDKLSPIIKDIEDIVDLTPPRWNNLLGRILRARLIKKIKKELIETKKFNEQNKKLYDARAMKMLVRKSVNLVKRKRMLDIAGWIRERKDRKKPGKTFMVEMELRNGFHTHFFVLLDHIYFDYEDGRYIIDDNYKFYNIATKIYCLKYHQDCCLPFKEKFDLKSAQTALMENKSIDTETSIDPKSLKIFIESDIIQKAMKGAEMDEWIRFIKLMLIVIVIINAVLFVCMLKLMFTK